MNLAIVAPFSTAVFLASMALDRPGFRSNERRKSLFTRLATPVNVNRELAGTRDQTTWVFRFLSYATGAVGLLSLLLLFGIPPADRPVVFAYSATTLIVAFGLAFIRGETPRNPS